MESCPSRTSAGSESGLRALAILFLVPGKLGKTLLLLSLFQGRRTLEHTLFLSSPSLPTSWGSLGWSRGAKLQKAAGVCPKASRRSPRENTEGLGADGRKPGCSGIRLPGRRPGSPAANSAGRGEGQVSLCGPLSFNAQMPRALCRPAGSSKASHSTQFALPGNSLHSVCCLLLLSFGQGLESDGLAS